MVFVGHANIGPKGTYPHRTTRKLRVNGFEKFWSPFLRSSFLRSSFLRSLFLRSQVFTFKVLAFQTPNDILRFPNK